MTVNGTWYSVGFVECRGGDGTPFVIVAYIDRPTMPFAFPTLAEFAPDGPPAAGAYSVVVRSASGGLVGSGEVSLEVGTPDSSATAQSGSVTVSYVNNRPQLDFADLPGRDDHSGLSSPLAGHFGCP